MARGRRKGAKSRVKNEGTDKDQDCKTPKDTKFSRGVNGRLSHASPVIQEKELITHYFHAVSSPEEVTEKEHILNDSFIAIEDEVEILEVVTHREERTPHKIQHTYTHVPQSPSSALQKLCITYSPKKPGKSRRRLNPSQAGNQQACLPKPVCCVKQNTGNHELTEYYPVRRSERKTKRTVLQEKQHQMEAAVLADCEDGLEVHNFEGKGRGVVSTRLFCKGEFVVEYAGELINITEAKSRERRYAQDQNTGCYMYYFHHRNTQYCVDATAESGRLGRLVNHSRNGNLMTKTLEIKNQPRLVLIAREDISPGEEVTYDYGDRSKESIRYHPWLLS